MSSGPDALHLWWLARNHMPVGEWVEPLTGEAVRAVLSALNVFLLEEGREEITREELQQFAWNMHLINGGDKD